MFNNANNTHEPTSGRLPLNLIGEKRIYGVLSRIPSRKIQLSPSKSPFSFYWWTAKHEAQLILPPMDRDSANDVWTGSGQNEQTSAHTGPQVARNVGGGKFSPKRSPCSNLQAKDLPRHRMYSTKNVSGKTTRDQMKSSSLYLSAISKSISVLQW